AMAHDRLTIALLSEVFPDAGAQGRLPAMLADARSRGAELVVLPELPLHPWSPARREPRDEDAEPPQGPRHRMLAGAARGAGEAVVRGAGAEESGARRAPAPLFRRGRRPPLPSHQKQRSHARGIWRAAP